LYVGSGGLPFCNVFPLLIVNRYLGFILMPIIVYIEKIVFLEKNASQKRKITQIKYWIKLSSIVNRTGSTLSTSVLSFKLITLIVIENKGR
jgi:hypothetical protein